MMLALSSIVSFLKLLWNETLTNGASSVASAISKSLFTSHDDLYILVFVFSISVFCLLYLSTPIS